VSLSVVEEAARGRLETADAVGGRYDVGSGGLEPCGSWVVAVGGVGEMQFTVGVWSPFSPLAGAAPPLSGVLLVVAVPGSRRGRSSWSRRGVPLGG
jgi:hypothetical protein